MSLYLVTMAGQVFYFGVCLLAILRGDRPLRYAATAIMANTLINPITRWGQLRDDPYWLMMALDLALVVALVILLLRDRRWWLVIATATFLMCALTHLAARIGVPLDNFTTTAARLVWAYAMIIAVACGLWTYERRGRAARI